VNTKTLQPILHWTRLCSSFVALVLFVAGISPRLLAQAAGNPSAGDPVSLGLPGKVSTFPTQLAFEPSRDLSGDLFSAEGHGYIVTLRPQGAAISLYAGPDSKSPRQLSLGLVGSNPQAAITPESPLPGVSNYIPSSDPDTWRLGVHRWSRVSYAQVYPGIDLSFYGNQQRLEYDFRLQPNADPAAIRMALGGIESATVDSDGNLVFQISGMEARLLRPVSYQLLPDGTRQAVDSEYRLIPTDRTGANPDQTTWQVGFTVGPHDASRPLVIDPVLSYGLQPAYVDYTVGGITVDSAGNTYTTGQNQSRGFYISKYTATGTLVFNTVVGSGVLTVYPSGIAVDSTGKIYVTGSAPPGLPTTSNAYQTVSPSSKTYYTAPFVAVFPAAGTAPTYVSYLGGTNNYDYASGIHLDSSNNIYITGYESSTNFPTTSGAYLSTYPGSTYAAFVAKINPTASGAASLVYSTLLGATTISSAGAAISVDAAGDAYVAVQSYAGYPTTTGAFQYNGAISDTYSLGSYITKVNPTGTALLYSAYLGPGAITGIALDTSLDAYVTGTVGADDFPTTSGAYQTTYPGGFVTELNPAGSALVYSTFLSGPSGAFSPGSNTVFPQSIVITPACASACAVYVGGYTSATDFPAINAIESTPPINVSPNPFVVELAGNGGSALLSTYLTGVTASVTSPFSTPIFPTPSIAVDGSGNMYLAANISGAADFPLTLPAATQVPYSYLAKISPSAGGLIVPYPKSLDFDNYIYAEEAVGVSSTLAGIPVPLVLRNLGSSPVAISSLTFSPSTEFSETDNCALTIPAGGSCTLNMAFTPIAKGLRTATLSIASNAAVTPVTVALSGTAQAEGYLQVSTNTLTFPSANLGTTSAVQTITVTNIGQTLVNLSPFTVSSVRANWGNGSDFQVLSNCPAQLLPAANCTFGVTFTPLASGPRAAQVYLQGDGYGDQYLTFYGSGISGTQGTVSLSATMLNFNAQLINTASARQTVTLTSTGTAPVSIYSVTIATTGQTGTSDFAIASGSCVSTSLVSVNPQATCSVNILYTPTVAAAETGTLTITDSATGTPHVVTLTGSGIAATQSLEFTPGNYVFPDQPIGVPSTASYFYVYNTGTAPITVDRVLATGDFSVASSNCPGLILKPNPAAGYEPSPNCSVRVSFTSSAAGARTGSLTFVDSAGASQVLTLAGNGITATGGIFLEPSTLTYSIQAVGTTSATQRLTIANPGNSPVSLTNIVSTGDYALVDSCAGGTFPYLLGAGRTCYVDISFTPTKVTATDTGTVVVSSTAGPATQTLTGSSVAATAAIGLTPTALNLGNVVTASQSSAYYIYVRNTGTEALTLTSGTVSGANAADFLFSGGSCGFYANPLAAGASCYILIYLTPSAAGARAATLTLVDSAGTQTVALTGTGVASLTGIQPAPVGLAFDQVAVGNVSASNQYVYLHNYGAAAVVISTAKISAGGSDFLIPVGDDSCSGATVAANSYCLVQVEFSPSAAGYQTGTLTFTDSTSKTYAVTLAGYAPVVATSSYIDPASLAFPGQVLTTYSASQTVSLNNTSDVPLTVGALTGTNTIVGTATTGAFSLSYLQGGSDSCSGQTVAPRSKCTVSVAFAPTAAGSATGSVVFPVKYAGGATTSYTLTLSGTGLAVKDSAELSPAAITFQDQAVGAQTSYGADATQAVNLWNTGNLPFTVGALTATDTVIGSTTAGDFTTSGAYSGYDGCSSQTVAPNSYCTVTVAFNPAATGAKTGSIKFPVTYSDKTTTTLTANLAGKAIADNSKVVVSPTTGQFDVQVVGTTSDSSETLTFTMSNTGNLPVKVTTATITTPFSFVSDGCSGTTISINSYCQIVVAFSPTAASAVTGTLSIPNSAAGSPQVIHLSGTGILATKQIALSQTSIAFGNQVVATKSATVTVLVSKQSGATVPVSAVTLAGTNASDFIETNTCAGSSIYGHSNCSINVQFAPASTSTGVRTATITETDTASGSPRIITLTGTGIAAAPAAAVYPASLNFGSQALSTKSAPLTFSVTNTGASALNISTVVSSNPTEFPVTTNGCAGKSIAAGADCLVSVTFDPNAGSTQTATITVTDNASPATQTLTVTGVSVGTPQAVLTPTSLAFGNEGVGVTSAVQTITLSDPGTDTLKITAIALTGTNAADFKQTNTCGTSIVAGANCVISITFDPAALGARTASLSITDNAGNVAGTIQTAALTGTGIGVPKIAFSPTSLAFASTNVGAKSAVSTITVSNPGTATLPITGVSIVPATNFTQTNTCGTSLAVGSTCVISVTFAPTVAGALTASVSVADGAAASPQTVALSGTAVGVPAATLSATTIAFGDQAVGVASGAQSVTLTNTGSGPLVVASVKLAGANATDFTETSTACPGTLAPAAACTLSVTFKPAASGARAGTITITDNAGNVANSTQTISLTGTGSGTPQAKLSATTLTLPSTAVGSEGGPQSVTLNNPGNGPLAISSIAISGADPRDFLELDTCQPSVAVGATCEIEVYFAPSAIGTRTANVVITDNANNVVNATQTIAVTGTATGAPQASLSTTTLAFGTVKAGTESNGLSVTLTNTGNAPLTVASVVLGGTDPSSYSIFSSCTSVTEGSSCIVVAFFKPTATGNLPATITFTDNSNNVAGTKQVVNLTGTGD
jgi:hypothetical protein